MKIKTNDNVKVISGKSRNKTGKIIQVFPAESRVVVEGLNIIKKHLRPQKRGEKGQIIELSAPMSSSNVMLVCPKCSKPTRVKYIFDKDIKRRACAKCGQPID